MPQFIIEPDNISGSIFSIKGAEARHLIKAVRIKPGDKIYLIALAEPGKPSKRYSASVDSVAAGTVSGKILCEITSGGQLHDTGINIFAALIKHDRFELMLEKLTEIGVDGITPVVTERAVKYYSSPSSNKIERWHKIMRSAAKQCCCEKVPVLNSPISFAVALKNLSRDELNLIAWEHFPDEQHSAKGDCPQRGLSPDLCRGRKLNIFFGPEGGFTEKEISLAKSSGLIPFTLGKNIMRAETAAIVAAGTAALLISRGLSPLLGTIPVHRRSILSKIVSVAEMRELDRKAIEEYGIPGIVLMENAGKEIALAALELAGGERRSAAVFCGSGNNGGDGLVAARFLKNAGCGVHIFLAKSALDFKGDALTNFYIVRKMGIPVTELNNVNKGTVPAIGDCPRITNFDLIIDALIGTGLKENVSGIYKDVIEMINKSGKPVISADVPSGLNGDTGEPMGAAVRATVTVTMGCIKSGLKAPAAKNYTGRIVVADIGIPVVQGHCEPKAKQSHF